MLLNYYRPGRLVLEAGLQGLTFAGVQDKSFARTDQDGSFWNQDLPLRGYEPLAALQLEYSLVSRSLKREHQIMMQELGIGLCAWSPWQTAFSLESIDVASAALKAPVASKTLRTPEIPSSKNIPEVSATGIF